MCICVSQEGEELSSCLWSITHPCIVGRKVTSFCAFLWAIVIPQLNSCEFIQPSWILSVYFYICGERQPRREREEEEPYCFCRAYNGIYTEAWNSSYKYFRTLISAEINFGNTPRGNQDDLFSALPHLPLLHKWLPGESVALVASLEVFSPPGRGGLGMDQSQTWVTAAECCPQQLNPAGWAGGPGLLYRGSQSVALLKPVEIVVLGSWGVTVAVRMFEWTCYLQDMKYSAGVSSFKEGLGKHLCMEIPQQGCWWVLIYSWVE